ncbi:MAG: ferritin, partial [Chitinophagales bacterium]|nr:ferritin [Chitinophagales bacterium]
QHEEEKLFRTVIEKIKLIGDDPKGHYWIDKELAGMSASKAKGAGGAM